MTIPGSVEYLGAFSFQDCTSLESVTIPESVTELCDGAFFGCTSLVSITVAENNPNYSSEDGVLFDKGKTALMQYPIGNTRASYTIPGTVESVDTYAFVKCGFLTSITVDGSSTKYSSEDGVLFNKEKTRLVQYPIGNTRASYAIPGTVETVGDYAFCGCTALTSVTIPYGVRNFGNSAFEDCTSLGSAVLPGSMTSIGFDAFRGCTALTSVTIPDSVKTIYNSAFKGCTALTSVAIPGSVTRISGDAFCGCTSLGIIVFEADTWNIISIEED